MRERRVGHTDRAARAVRGLWPDHNPLRRSSDRAEAVIVVVLVAAFLIGTPLIALLTWRVTVSSTFSTTQAASAGWRQTSAVLLADEPGWTDGYGSLVPVSWSAPDGVRHRGQFLAAPGARAGTRVTVWTDASGRLTQTPMSPRQAVTQADLAAAIAILVWALTLLCAGMAGRHVLDRRRLAAWEAGWRTLNFSGPAGASPDR